MRSSRRIEQERVETVVGLFCGEFTLNDVELSCPGVSPRSIKKALRNLKKEGTVTCRGRGSKAIWVNNYDPRG